MTAKKDKKNILDLEVRRLDLLYRQNFAGLVVVFASSTAFALTTWKYLSWWFLVPWFVTLNSSTVLRMVVYRLWLKSRDHITSVAETKPWLRFMHVLLSISGLGWGVIGWMSPNAPPQQQSMTTLIISAMVGGTLATNAPSKTAMYCMGVPSLSLWAAGMLLTGDPNDFLMASLILVFLVMMIVVGNNLNRSVVLSLGLNGKLREGEERLRLARDASQSLSWNWDLETGEFLCEGNLSLISEPEKNLQTLLLEKLDTGDTLDLEDQFPDRAGIPHYIALRGQISRDENGNPVRVAGICWDMTAQKNQEAIRHERDILDAANKSKSVFIANASHEIRTPLAAINGFADALLQKPELADCLKNDVKVIARHGKYMVSLVNDLLDLSKVETNRLYIQKAWMNPAQEIEDALSVIRSALDYKNLNLSVVYKTLIPEKIESDATRFRQVVINLLSNAVKFTSSGTIQLEISFREDKRLVVAVEDSGPGMTLETCRNLFKPFVRGETPEVQRVQGSGLGLALSRNLARLLGGDLQMIFSRPKIGTRFEFSVDPGLLEGVAFVQGDQVRLKEHENPAIVSFKKVLQGRKILVVEDSVDLQVLMRHYLEKMGAQIQIAENGLAGVNEALNSVYDVVLMDIKMPIMDGYQATKQLREGGYLKPIIALTANASLEDQQMCYQAGCDGYLSKPVDMNLLLEVLQSTTAKTANSYEISSLGESQPTA